MSNIYNKISKITNNLANFTNALNRRNTRNLTKEKTLEREIDKSDEAFIEINKVLTFPDDVIIRQ